MLNINTEILEMGLSSPELSVLLHIAKRTNGIKVAFPSRDLLKKETKLGRDALSKAIKGLIDRKLISAQQEKNEGGKFSKTVYTLLTDKIKSYHGKNRDTETCTTVDKDCDRDTGFRTTGNRSTENTPLSISNYKELETLTKENNKLKKKVAELNAKIAKRYKGLKLLEVVQTPETWSNDLTEQVKRFFKYRVERKKPYDSLTSLEARIKKFSKEVEQFGEAQTIGAIIKAIESHWLGVDVSRHSQDQPTPTTKNLVQAYQAHLQKYLNDKQRKSMNGKIQAYLSKAGEKAVQAEIRTFKANFAPTINPTFTEALIFDFCYGSISQLSGSGTTPEKAMSKFRQFYQNLSKYKQNKNDLRTDYKNYLIRKHG